MDFKQHRFRLKAMGNQKGAKRGIFNIFGNIRLLLHLWRLVRAGHILVGGKKTEASKPYSASTVDQAQAQPTYE